MAELTDSERAGSIWKIMPLPHTNDPPRADQDVVARLAGCYIRRRLDGISTRWMERNGPKGRWEVLTGTAAGQLVDIDEFTLVLFAGPEEPPPLLQLAFEAPDLRSCAAPTTSHNRRIG